MRRRASAKRLACSQNDFCHGLLGRGPHLSLLHEIFDCMVKQLAEEVQDLGEHTAGDATSLLGRRLRSKKKAHGDLPQPTGGLSEARRHALGKMRLSPIAKALHEKLDL